MTIEQSESLVVKDMVFGYPVTIVVECLDIPKTMFEDSFTGIYIHSLVGKHDIKNRKDLDKASKDVPNSEISVLHMNLDDAKKLYTFLGRGLGYGQALKELDQHR